MSDAQYDDDVPITAKFHVLTYHEHPLQRLESGGDVVQQTVLVTSPAAHVQVLDVVEAGDGSGRDLKVRLVLTEPAFRNTDGVVVPAGELVELKARHEAAKAEGDEPKLITPEGGEQ